MRCPKCGKIHSYSTLEEIELSSMVNLLCVKCLKEKDNSNEEFIKEKERIIIEKFFEICETTGYSGSNHSSPGIGNLYKYIYDLQNDDDVNRNEDNIYNRVIEILFGVDINDVGIEDLESKSMDDIDSLIKSYRRDKKIDIILNLP